MRARAVAARWLAAGLLALAGCGGGGGGGDPPAPEGWRTLAALPAGRVNATAAAPGNGWLYVFNGYTTPQTCSVGTSDGRVFAARVEADGTLGAWTEGTAGPAGFRRSMAGVATANGFIYVAGGAINAPSWNGAIWFARANADGTLSGWTEATAPAPGWIGSSAVAAAWDGVLYAGGGLNIGAEPNVSTHLYAAPLDPVTGQPGPWAEAGTLPFPTLGAGLAFAGGRAYLVPGSTGQVWVAPVNADAAHTLGPWVQAAATVPTAAASPHLVAVGTRLYVLAGSSPDLSVSTLGADGAPGPFTLHSSAPESLWPLAQAAVAGGRLYVLGNSDCAQYTPARAAAVYVSPRL